MFSWLLLIILYSIISHAQGWGRVGHSLVAHLAQSRLDTGVLKWMKTHLTNEMSEIAFWADSIHNGNDNLFGFNAWRWSKTLHYINTPPWNCTYMHERDCINDRCTYGALKNYSRRLMTYENSLLHQQDFFFLVHFVGDVHQPLHVGFKDDAGGNGVSVRFYNTSTNLHSLWDTSMLTYRIRTSFESNYTSYFNYLHLKMMNEKPEIKDDDFTKWITESVDIVCQQVYFDEMNNTMNSSGRYNLAKLYYERSWPIVEKRLIQAGSRLGALLNRVLKVHAESITTTITTITTTITTITTTTKQTQPNSALSIEFSLLNLVLVISGICYVLYGKL